MKQKKKVLWLVTILFYCCMLVLAITAKRRHQAELTEVTVMIPLSVSFDEGVAVNPSPALPEEMVQREKLFEVVTEVVNGEERTIVHEIANISLGREKDGVVEVVQGISSLGQIVVTGWEDLQDGDEVIVH